MARAWQGCDFRTPGKYCRLTGLAVTIDDCYNCLRAVETAPEDEMRERYRFPEIPPQPAEVQWLATLGIGNNG